MTTPLGIALNAVATQLGQLIETTFPDKCSIQRPEYNPAPEYFTIAESVGCSWGPAGKNSKEYVRALKITGVTVYEITVAGNVDVQAKDRIVVEARGNEAEHTFEVNGPPIRNAGLPMIVLCTLEE